MLSTNPVSAYDAIRQVFKDNEDLNSTNFFEETLEALMEHQGVHNGNIKDEYEVAYSVCHDAILY